MNICVYGASSESVDKKYHDASYALGKALAKRGHSMVFGGGAKGLMGAAARGVHDAGGGIIGVAPSFFNVDGVLFEKCTEFVFTNTMRERKQIMEDRADAFIALPGGLGTFDELFEILTLRQLARHTKPIAILNVDGYYDALLNMINTAVSEKFMIPENAGIFGAFDDPERLLDYLEACRLTEADAKILKDI